MGFSLDRSRHIDTRLTFMASLILVLALLTVATRMPWTSTPSYRLSFNKGQEAIPIESFEIESPEPIRDEDVQGGSAPSEIDPVPESEAEPVGDLPESIEQSAAIPDRLLARDQILDFAEEPPSIVGGLGSYYINIEYPQEAIDANIQGRLVLRFVVDRDGSTHSIEVAQSLHPLCDSAAVRAVRLTSFTPGVQNGKPVPVRMSLPVVFRIVGPQDS